MYFDTFKSWAEVIREKTVEAFVKLSIDFKETVANASSQALGWLAIVFIQAMTIPTLVSMMTGVTDVSPPIDMVLIAWTALALFFIKATIQKDVLNLLTIGLGFFAQAILMALIFFK